MNAHQRPGWSCYGVLCLCWNILQRIRKLQEVEDEEVVRLNAKIQEINTEFEEAKAARDEIRSRRENFTKEKQKHEVSDTKLRSPIVC